MRRLRPRWFVFLIVLCWACAWQPLRGDDPWGHAAIGRWIAQNAAIPRETLHLWSVYPIPWVAHAWATQLSFYGLMSAGRNLGGEAGGAAFLLCFTTLITVATFGVLWHYWRSNGPTNALTTLLFGLAIWRSLTRLHPRPEIFTGLFLALLLVFLVQWPEKSSDHDWKISRLIFIALLFCLWPNFHAGVVLGLAILASTVFVDLVQDRFSRRSLQLAGAALGCLGLVFACNPFGLGYLSAFAEARGAMFLSLSEHRPLWMSPPTPIVQLILSFGFAILALFAWAKNPHKRWAQAAWIVLMTMAYILARRNSVPLMLVALVVLGANAQFLPLFFREPPRWTRPLTALAIVSLIVFTRWLVFLSSGGVLWGATSAGLPVRLCDFVQKNVAQGHFTGQIFNDYENSGYYQWRLAPKIPLFIDLHNAYPESLFLDYQKIIAGNPQSLAQFNSSPIGYVILGHETSDALVWARFARFLDFSPQWQRVYIGQDGGVWKRRIARP